MVSSTLPVLPSRSGSRGQILLSKPKAQGASVKVLLSSRHSGVPSGFSQFSRLEETQRISVPGDRSEAPAPWRAARPGARRGARPGARPLLRGGRLRVPPWLTLSGSSLGKNPLNNPKRDPNESKAGRP